MVKEILVLGIIFILLGYCISSSTGNISNVSFDFKSNNPPYEPSDPHPENGATDVSVHVILNWTADDPDGDNLTYDIYFGNYTPPPKVLSNGSTSKYNPPGLLEFCTTYYWKIIVWDEHGESTSGPIWNFTTRCNDPPNNPIPIYPSNGSVEITINFYLEWNCNDPDDDNITYDIFFGNTSPPQMIESNWTGKIYEDFPYGTPFEFNTTYYWKIIAWDIYGASNKSSIWSFTTIEFPPKTLYVGELGPDNYTKIQDAIDNASDGDTIFVFDNSSPYYENVIINKSINLIGENKNTTVIDGSGLNYVIRIEAYVNLSGFTIQNSDKGIINYIPPPPNNIYKFIIFNNVIYNNKNGIFIFGSLSHIISKNIFKNNEIGINFFFADKTEVKNNNFINNEKDAYFEYLLFFQFMPRIKWNGNYWDNWNKVIPKPIKGFKVFMLILRPGSGIKIAELPWFNFDWHPSKQPYS